MTAPTLMTLINVMICIDEFIRCMRVAVLLSISLSFIGIVSSLHTHTYIVYLVYFYLNMYAY